MIDDDGLRFLSNILPSDWVSNTGERVGFFCGLLHRVRGPGVLVLLLDDLLAFSFLSQRLGIYHWPGGGGFFVLFLLLMFLCSIQMEVSCCATR